MSNGRGGLYIYVVCERLNYMYFGLKTFQEREEAFADHLLRDYHAGIGLKLGYTSILQFFS